MNSLIQHSGGGGGTLGVSVGGARAFDFDGQRLGADATISHLPVAANEEFFGGTLFDGKHLSAEEIEKLTRPLVAINYESLIETPATIAIDERPIAREEILHALFAHANQVAVDVSLAEALQELAELDDYAREEGLVPPDAVAKEFAQTVIRKITAKFPRYYSVSLWEDGDVIIATGDNENRVSVYCRANGGASIYISPADDNNSEHHYKAAHNFSFELVEDALQGLQ